MLLCLIASVAAPSLGAADADAFLDTQDMVIGDDVSASLISKTNPNLNFFGYYNANPGEIFEMRSTHINIVHTTNFEASVNELRASGVKAIVPVGDFFYERVNSTSKTWKRKTDLTRWYRYVNDVLWPNRDVIFALYDIDEPNLKGLTHADLTWSSGLINVLKTSWGSQWVAKTMVNFADPLGGLFSDITKKVPPGYDWVMFDLNTTNDNLSNPTYITNSFTYLKDRLSVNQKVWVCPDVCASTKIDAKTDEMLRWYYMFANDHTKIIGILPFIWKNSASKPNVCNYTVFTLPLTQQSAADIGWQLTRW